MNGWSKDSISIESDGIHRYALLEEYIKWLLETHYPDGVYPEFVLPDLKDRYEHE